MKLTHALAEEIIKHYLGNIGFVDEGYLAIFYQAGTVDKNLIDRAINKKKIVVLIKPTQSYLDHLNITQHSFFQEKMPFKAKFSRLNKLLFKTLFPWDFYKNTKGDVLLRDTEENPVWVFVEKNNSSFLILGTDLLFDIISYTNGLPNSKINFSAKSKWGFNFERINYLFESNINLLSKHERYADNWLVLLDDSLATLGASMRRVILPNAAKAAIIITGDDDQAYIEKYQQQQMILGRTPITYFMHPLTRHNSKTIKKILRKPHIDLGIHPDALDFPENYDEIILNQYDWFFHLFKQKPISVRNHGFLNKGYWGHLPIWQQLKIKMSSNIPGFNGTVLNGTLLPYRLYKEGELSDHWSILTAIGDGVLFAGEYTESQGAQCIYDLAESILLHPLPGIMVLNLHPQNVEKSFLMHKAVLELIDNGFLPMTLCQCYEWFAHRIDFTSRLATFHRWKNKIPRGKLWALTNKIKTSMNGSE